MTPVLAEEVAPPLSVHNKAQKALVAVPVVVVAAVEGNTPPRALAVAQHMVPAVAVRSMVQSGVESTAVTVANNMAPPALGKKAPRM